MDGIGTNVAQEEIDRELSALEGEWEPPADVDDIVGRTMFDLPNSQDTLLTVLLPVDRMQAAPSQSLVRIKSDDGRAYLGIVVAGPFADPDGLRADASLMVTTTVRGGIFMPNYHGRVVVELLGEETPEGALLPPRFRPKPNSPVYALTAEETARAIGCQGDVRIGRAAGHEHISVTLDTRDKNVLPRHTAILGTTGSGKSNTVATLLAQLQQRAVATILFDTEGEYTAVNQATSQPKMVHALERAGVQPRAVANSHLYHLAGRETSNPRHPDLHPFSLLFSNVSPHTVCEILDLSDAQTRIFFTAYETCKRILREGDYFPHGSLEQQQQQERQLLDLDEFESGYPRLGLQLLHDVVSASVQRLQSKGDEAPRGRSRAAEPEDDAAPAYTIRTHWIRGDARREEVFARAIAAAKPTELRSWLVLQGKLSRLARYSVFDQPNQAAIDYDDLIQPGSLTLVDLSDTDSPQLNNLVIADILRGVQMAQDHAYQRAQEAGAAPTPVVIIIEEAHEFLARGKMAAMPMLFQQVVRIARRGRKRWLGLVFVTQLPQHLPTEVLGLVNNVILHKISDSGVVSELRRFLGEIDDSLWARLPTLAPGQAIVSFGGMKRPLLTAIDPAPCALRLTE